MWRWTALVFLVVLHKNTSSEPITDDGNNDRSTRQLDFKECCPCDDFGKSNVNQDDQERLVAASEHFRTRDVDDCPCRFRDSDSQGAPSLLFPTAMRAAGTFLSPDENKEDLKPIFNPEVDLASSVLETLREATDEEYRDALARDAAKSAARAEGDFTFGDAAPQESANIVTIVVNPEIGDDDDDVVPQASNIKKVRCIQPLQSDRSILGRMRMDLKPISISRKPKLSKLRPGLLHRHFYDMDSGVAASNVNKHIVPFDEDTKEAGLKSSSYNRADENYKNKAFGSQSNSDRNKLGNIDLSTPSLLQSIRDKTVSTLSRVPKFRLEDLFSENNNEDLRPSPSIAREETANKLPNFRTNSQLNNAIHNRRPLSLTNLLNLRDVELLPLKGLIGKSRNTDKFNKSKLRLPSLFNHDNTEILNKKEAKHMWKSPPIKIEINKAKDTTGDPEGSSSIVNIQVKSTDEITNENCNNEGLSGETNAKEADSRDVSTEIQDNLPNIKNELPKIITNDDIDCLETENSDRDSTSDTSNKINDIIEHQEARSFQEEKVTDESLNPSTTNDQKAKLNLLHLMSVDKTITTIKESIAKKLDDLKNIKTTIKNKNTVDPEKFKSETASKDIMVAENENQDSQKEVPEQITQSEQDVFMDKSAEVTTLYPHAFSGGLEDIATTNKPEALGDNAEKASKSSFREISLQDLQKLSDSMLQQEECQIKNMKNSKTTNEEFPQTSANNNMDVDLTDSNNSANTHKEMVAVPEDLDDFQDRSVEEKTCKSDIALQKSSHPLLIDDHSESSEILGSQSVLQPTLSLLKKPLPDLSEVLNLPPLDPLRTLDDIKLKLTNFFDKSERNDVDFSPSETKTVFDTLDTFNPTMESDASTSNFQSRAPPSSILEDINFDILELKPQSSILSNIPKLGLHSYKTILPIPKGLSLKPIKLQSALENKRGLLGATISIREQNNRPNFSKLRSNGKTSNLLNDYRDRLLDSPFAATDNVHSTLKNTHDVIESKLRELTRNNIALKSPIKSYPSLLDSISRNHEDMSDKLRALHIDLNDRIETMRNELKDRSNLLTSGSRNSKSNSRKSSSASKARTQPSKGTWQASSRRDSQKTFNSRKKLQQTPAKTNSVSRTVEQKKLRIPAAASVPVPKTVEVPKLKATFAKSPPSALRTSSSLKSSRIGVPPKSALGRLASNSQSSDSLLRNRLNVKKENKIKVSFSTTPRPAMLTGHRRSSLQNSGKNQGKLELKRKHLDHNGSPSEISQSKITAPVSYHLNDKKLNLEIDTELPQRAKATSREANPIATKTGRGSSKSVLRSWPKATESAFLSKVKEAVQTRLSKVNSLKTLKLSSLQIDELPDSKTDMARSASENKEIVVGSPLKENTPYKCKMICSKE